MVLHVFNPENDLALADFAPYYIAPASARMMRADLSVLPLWWASDGDVIWTELPEVAERYVHSACVNVPAVGWWKGGDCPTVAAVEPWGWSPALVCALGDAGCPGNLLPTEEQLHRYRQLSGRAQAVRLLQDLREAPILGKSFGNRLCGLSICCATESEVANAVASFPKTILKAPWSGSGKGLRFAYGTYGQPLSGWCRRVLENQKAVVVEPLYEKRFDFAFEFFSDGHSVRYVGLSVFLTTSRGTYGGNWVASEAVKEAWLEQYVPRPLCMTLRTELEKRIGRLVGGDYKGYLGVDMMLCKMSGTDELFVHPCVEVNLRRTMGLVAVDLAHYLAPGAEGFFYIDYEKEAGRLQDDHLRRLASNPPQVADGRMVAGYLNLTPVNEHTHYRARLDVTSSPGSLFDKAADF